MRPIFCGNFEVDAHQSDLERLFRRYGKVDKMEMKSGFAFVYMDDERDAEDAIQGLDRKEFGTKGRRLRVEWTKHVRGGRKPAGSRRGSNLQPSKTLFVINFPHHTRTRDLEHHFESYGKLVNVRIRRNFAFVQYESQEDATKALDAANMSKFLDRVISVEYAARGDDDRRNGYSPDGRRGRNRSPDRRRRSPSPRGRERGSPDYGRGSSPAVYRRARCSPEYGVRPSPSPRRGEMGSADYGRHLSPSPRRGERSSLDYDRARSHSPRQGKVSPECRWALSPSPHQIRTGPQNGRVSSPSPPHERTNVDNGRAQSPSALQGRTSPDHGQIKDLNPPRGKTSPGYGRDRSSSPRRGGRASSDYHDRSMSPQLQEKVVNDNGTRHRSASPYPREEDSPDCGRGPSPSPTGKPLPMERSPIDEYEN